MATYSAKPLIARFRIAPASFSTTIVIVKTSRTPSDERKDS
jgi:hypothetical protein